MAESCVSLTSQGHEEHHRWRLLPRHNWGARESHGLPKDWRYCSAAPKLSTVRSSEQLKANSRGGYLIYL